MSSGSNTVEEASALASRTTYLRTRYVANELAAVKKFKVGLVGLMGHATTAELAHSFFAHDAAPGSAAAWCHAHRQGVPADTRRASQQLDCGGPRELWLPNPRAS